MLACLLNLAQHIAVSVVHYVTCPVNEGILGSSYDLLGAVYDNCVVSQAVGCQGHNRIDDAREMPEKDMETLG